MESCFLATAVGKSRWGGGGGGHMFGADRGGAGNGNSKTKIKLIKAAMSHVSHVSTAELCLKGVKRFDC